VNQPLLIIGASARAAAQSAHRAGFQVLAADLFADRDLVSVADSTRVEDYPDGSAAIVRELSAKYANLGVIYSGAIENYPDLLSEIETHSSLIGNSSEVVRAVRNPLRLQNEFRRHSIPFPQSQAESPRDITSRRWLRKHIRSAGGLRVQVADSSDEAASDYIFQAWIEGNVCSAAYVSDGQRVELMGVSEMLVGTNWLGGSDFKYCGSLTRQCSDEERAQWKFIGEALGREFGLIGSFGVDAVLQDSSAPIVVPIEVNPRYTASMELFETDSYSVVQHHVQAYHGGPVAIPSVGETIRAKCIVYATESIEFPQNYALLQQPGIELADIPQSQVIEAGHPILTMLAESRSREELIESLKIASERIRDQLAQDK